MLWNNRVGPVPYQYASMVGYAIVDLHKCVCV